VAVAYKSAGAGANSGNATTAVNPVWPATVDAGDIAILHYYARLTTHAPAAVGSWSETDWTLLSGPNAGGDGSNFRHWAYGKIAAGTEDGATITGTGTSAEAVEKMARIYTFSGRVSGTITDLTGDFSHIANTTDPQGPTVTTPAAGALAVALLAQSDNNTWAAIAGMSGGTWVEDVADYSQAMTAGAVIALNSCIPTADPGTVTGGAVVATNDPSGTIGFYIRDSPAGAAVTVRTLASTGVGK
jgi:hypothetical protein